MADPSTLSTAALMELQREQKDLIDTIDKLRALGVGGIVDLPQIIVVGDQSSGKSSVLEAISQHKFPAKDGICTRFATQLSLRRSATPSAKVSIETNGSDDPELRPFEASDFDSDQEVGDIIEEAKQKMSAKIAQDGVSEDILHIEISGPDMPMLTLVDLPGFYHSETKDQSAEGIAIVERLANRYMSQKSSIILTIVSGKYDIALQTVHNRVLQHDPQGLRTMGIITKADFIRANSQFLSLARNEEPKYRYGLGWHVLRNRTEDEADISNEERDATEDRLFQSQIWRDFPQKSKGIKALRQRLSNALYQHIKKNMPGLVEELRTQIKTREAQLERLGPARASPQELRYYLTTISTRFARLADYAIKGYYIDAFFEGPGSEARRDGSTERIHKLRALVRNLNCVFYETMLTKGHSRAIVDPDNVLMNNNVMFRPSGLSQAVKQAMGPWLDHYDFPDPKPVSLNELMAQIDVRATDNRGTELPGSANDDLAVSEFKEQSSRWESIATRHIETISDVSQTFVEELLAYIIGSDRHSHNSIMAEVVEPFFEERRLTLKAKLAELLRHFKHGSPQPLDAEFRERMELRQQKRLLGQKAPGDLNGRRRVHSSSEDVIEKMMTCYDMSLKIFTDNVIILAIENCLISEIPNILEANMVNHLGDDQIRELVAERREVTEEREQLEKSLGSLHEGLRACRRHRVMDSTDTRSRLPPPPPQQSINPTASRGRLEVPAPSSRGQSHHHHQRTVSTPSSSSSSLSPPSQPATPSSRVVSPSPSKSLRYGEGRKVQQQQQAQWGSGGRNHPAVAGDFFSDGFGGGEEIL